MVVWITAIEIDEVEKTMYCPYCNVTRRPDNAPCANCGAPAPSMGPAPQNTWNAGNAPSAQTWQQPGYASQMPPDMLEAFMPQQSWQSPTSFAPPLPSSWQQPPSGQLGAFGQPNQQP